MQGFTFIEPTDSIPKKPLFIVIGGYPGLGKTSVSFTADQVLHIDVDKGVERASQKKRPLTVRIQKYGDFKAYVFSQQFADEVQKRGIKAVALDTVGALLEDTVSPYLIASDSKNARAGGLSLQGWGSLQVEFNQLIERFFSLNLSVIGIAHAKEEGDDGPKQLRLAVKGGSNEIIMRKADMLGFITMRQNKRTLDFNPTDYQIGKNTAQLPAMLIPDDITPEYDNFLQTVIDKTYDRMAQLSDAQAKAVEVITYFSEKTANETDLNILAEMIDPESIKDLNPAVALQVKSIVQNRYAFVFASERCAGKTTDEEFNTVIEDLKNFPVHKGFEVPVFTAIKSVATEQGLVYNSKDKKFTKKV